VVYGAKLKVEDGAVVQLVQTLVEWILTPLPVLTEIAGPRERIVIPTGADPDFLLSNASNDHVCGSP
jgi:hypothetical protein